LLSSLLAGGAALLATQAIALVAFLVFFSFFKQIKLTGQGIYNLLKMKELTFFKQIKLTGQVIYNLLKMKELLNRVFFLNVEKFQILIPE